MTSRLNTRNLVMRRDRATGMIQVGWDADLPRGRYEHLAVICNSTSYCLPDRDSNEYQAYQSALHEARQVNQRVLAEQVRRNQAKGWMPVPFDLAENPDTMIADRVGSFADAAMQLQHQLTQKQKVVWAVVQDRLIIHVRSRHSKKQRDDLTKQVWYHNQLNELGQLGGTLFEGELMVFESGLWFRKKVEPDQC